MSMMRIPKGEFIVSVSMTTASAIDAFMLNSVNESRLPSPACDSWNDSPPIGVDDWPSFFFLPFFDMA